MALRVLLADESSTIKKVMQLALADFGVEVKAVPIGLDVPQVISNFHPDIVFVDILLAKKNGYEVCTEIKSTPATKNIPVVLMWSGFMELDEAKALSCKADRRLEKPFDADTLRGLVNDLVKSASENEIINFLSFPALPEIVEDKKEPAVVTAAPPPTPVIEEDAELTIPEIAYPEEPKANLPRVTEPLADFDEPEEFQAVPLPKTTTLNTLQPAQKSYSPTEDWSHKDLSQFKINVPLDDFDEVDPMPDMVSPSLSSAIEEISLDELEELSVPQANAPRLSAKISGTLSSEALSASQQIPTIDTATIERIIREQVRETLESIAWKIIPDLAETIIKDELKKLLKDAEQL